MKSRNRNWNNSLILECSMYIVFLIVLSLGSIQASDILGCGGFVKSPYKLDFDKIEIKLFTKQGSLKLKTDCAPTTGYYFIPLENKGDFVVKISPPEGWTFEPSEYSIQFDGLTDKCSKGEDINFVFKGFAILGKVISSGFDKGPSGVTLSLSGPDNLKLNVLSVEGGSFAFDSIPPGLYSLKASYDGLKFEKDSYKFEITNKNILVDNNQLVVNGYDLTGRVSSDGNPVESVSILLLSEDNALQIPQSCKSDKTDGLNLPNGIKGKVICVQNSDKAGTFRFAQISPGKYTVVPVYKGANIVYNVNPDRIKIEVDHASVDLKTSFEVEGFTVQGRVKGHSGASILVNGEVRATSGHDGTFTVAKMKPGTYEFEVIAEKFQFDKKRITIQPTNPIIPDFVPARFEICGTISISSKSATPQLTLAFQKTGDQVLKEKILDPNHSCIYLPEGIYSAWVESVPEKYFLPEKSQIQVPVTGSGFTFKEFSGSISGSLTCQFASCDGVAVRVINSQSEDIIQEKILTKGERKFKFENLDSGLFKLTVDGEKFCWKEITVENVRLKNSNVENIAFIQTGVPLEIQSSHQTTVKITGKTKAASQDLNLKANKVDKICLTDPDSPPESYQIVPIGCHEFDKAAYPLNLGHRVELLATKHLHSWNIISPHDIPDLKLTRNGESFTLDQVLNTKDSKVKVTKIIDGKNVNYEVSSMEEPNDSVKWQAFSYGFIFEPNSFIIDTLKDCQDKLLLVVAKQSHVIKGKFTPPLEGVEIRIELIGDPDSTIYVTSNAAGEYIAGPFVHPSGFKVTPEMNGYIFKPLDINPYFFSVYQLPKIQVKVQTGKDEASTFVQSVLLSLSGPNSYRQNKITDENGEMTFGDLQPGQYYLKALLKEFQFQPSSINVDLKEQETKNIVLKAIRESFSLYGQLSSLSGELMPNLLVAAKGIGNCSEYGEEGTSDEMGNFRIWALKSYCDYQITVVKKDEFVNSVERTIPDVLDVKVGAEDIQNISFVVITPVRRMDVSLRIRTNNEKSLDHLKAVVYSSRSPDSPLHVVPFNGISYIILPPIPKDGTEYTLSFESNLNKHQYNYKLPSEINFNADSAYAHFGLEFNIEPAPVDQEIGKNSYIAFAMIVLIVLLIANHEKVGYWIKDIMENYASNSNAMSAAKKSKSKNK